MVMITLAGTDKERHLAKKKNKVATAIDCAKTFGLEQ